MIFDIKNVCPKTIVRNKYTIGTDLKKYWYAFFQQNGLIEIQLICTLIVVLIFYKISSPTWGAEFLL